MTPERAQLLLRALGNHSAVVQDGEGPWITAQCPLYPFTHGKGKDKQTTHSFALNIEHDTFNCFVCEGGTLGKLFSLLTFHLEQKPEYAGNYDLKTVNLIISGAGADIAGLPAFTEFPAHQIFQEWPDLEANRHPKVIEVPRAVDYLVGRGCGPHMWDGMDFRYDYARDMIATPYRTADGLLAGMRGRAVDPTTPDAYKHYDYKFHGSNNASIIWCGEEALTTEKPVIVVEGQFDKAQVQQHYPHVLANLTAKVSPRKLAKLGSAPAVVLMFDNDGPGRLATVKVMEELRELYPALPVYDLEYPQAFKDPDMLARQGGNAIHDIVSQVYGLAQ